MHLGTRFKRLFQKRLIEGCRRVSSSNEIVERFATCLYLRGHQSMAVELDAGKRDMRERPTDAERLELLNRVGLCGPVFDALPVAVESQSNGSGSFVDDRFSPGSSQYDGGRQTRGPSAENTYNVPRWNVPGLMDGGRLGS
jgi:hypothetical protein